MNEREMYKAELVNGELIVTPVLPAIWKRIGHQGLGQTKTEAIEKLKKRIMDKFSHDIKAIDWQSIQYVSQFGEAPDAQ